MVTAVQRGGASATEVRKGSRAEGRIPFAKLKKNGNNTINKILKYSRQSVNHCRYAIHSAMQTYKQAFHVHFTNENSKGSEM